MKLASHNSWSYAKPQHWYMKPLRFFAQCQKKDIKEQWKAGARMFDLRVFFDKKGNPEVRHGSMTFRVTSINVLGDLNYLNVNSGNSEKTYVRVLLEQNYASKKQAFQEEKFQFFCKMLKVSFPDLIFVGGRRKYDWKVIYEFPEAEPEMIDAYSSTTSIFGGKGKSWHGILDDWCPRIYATLYNKKNIEKYKDQNIYLMIDFI